MMCKYEVRDPIHGFIKFNEWEREVINSPVFQRLRRIRQLAFTEMVYPGACHTRFEHSLGVMHVATLMFDSIMKKSREILKKEFKYNEDELERDRVLIRLSALLHDIGHCPFSHATEESAVFPRKPDSDRKYGHEDYNGIIIRTYFSDIVEGHPENEKYGLKVKDIIDFLNRSPEFGKGLLWMDLISSQIDADRCDYLLRDSHHLGVRYGLYDLDRVIVTLTLGITSEGEPRIMVEKGGWHAIEGMVIARYMMFTQVYYHKTRIAYDLHLVRAIGDLLKKENEEGVFPAPRSENDIKEYLDWDDWKTIGMIREGFGGEDAWAILNRKHMRCVHETSERAEVYEYKRLIELEEEIRESSIKTTIDMSSNSWYSFEKEDINIYDDEGTFGNKIKPVQEYSSIVKGLAPLEQYRIYVALKDKEIALEVRKKLLG